MRTKKALANIITSLVLQLVTVVSGLILPRLFILTFGSDANGLVSSITQFLSYISLLEGGVGGVITAALYRPLLNNDRKLIASIIQAAKRFYRVIGFAFIIYVVVLSAVFPLVVQTEHNTVYVVSLIVILSAGTLFQYFLSLAYINLLTASQNLWLINTINTVLLMCNVVLSYVMIKMGCSLHFVKAVSCVVFLVKPLFYEVYIRKKYSLHVNCAEAYKFKQLWNGFAHHIAYFIHNNTDIVVITLFLGVKEVSVYSVIFAVVAGIQRLVTSVSSGVAAGIGSLIAAGDRDKLNKVIDEFETLQFFLTTILFTITYVMIIPFVQVYIGCATDVNYIRPMFAHIMVLAYAVYCIRIIYSTITLNAGHYKETQPGAFGEAIANVLISIACVSKLGIVGVAIGTLTSMLLRCLYDVIYLNKNIAYRSISKFARNIVASMLSAIFGIIISDFFALKTVTSWSSWIVSSLIVGIIVFTISTIIFLLIEKHAMATILQRFLKKIIR